MFSLQITAVPRCLVARLKQGPDHKSSDCNRIDKSEKNKLKIAEAEAKVKENDIKSIQTSSGSLFGIDMFAEKSGQNPKNTAWLQFKQLTICDR